MTCLLQVEDLVIEAPDASGGRMRVVNEVSFELRAGEILALVGESGSGKSLTALGITRLLPEPAVRMASGCIRLEGQDLSSLSKHEMTAVRGAEIGMIFQEPMTALNPVFTIGEQVGETLRRHRSLSRSEARVETIQLLNRVALPNPSSRFHSYPHELSGGMRQRVMIAMAVASDPRVLIADEPTTALDVQTQRGVLDLLQSVVQAEGIGLLLITHDMALVGERADRICVLCQGRVCEMGDVEPVLSEPLHPYTRGLIACTPRLDGCRGDLPIMASALLSEEAWGPSPALQEGGQRLEPWRPPGDPVGGYHLQEVSDGRFVGVIPS